VLHDFSASVPPNALGWGPWASVILRGNTLYGTAENDENNYRGTIFKMTTDGTGFVRLHSFSPAISSSQGQTNWDGGLPLADLVLDCNTLYGTAAIYGGAGLGTVFSLQLPAPTAPPIISSLTQTNGTVAFTWSGNPGSSYQVQYKTDAASSNWSNLGGVLVATNETLSAADVIGTNTQRFYRIVLLPP
jgi:hypothetical protein